MFLNRLNEERMTLRGGLAEANRALDRVEDLRRLRAGASEELRMILAREIDLRLKAAERAIVAKPGALEVPANVFFERGARGKPGRFSVIASTDAPVRRGSYYEVLLHRSDCVVTQAAVSVLFNHDPYQIIGGIVEAPKADGHRLKAELEIDPDVVTPGGAKLLTLLSNRSVRGVSVGYECDFSNPRNFARLEKSIDGLPVIQVKKWILREISITPTPADLDALVLGAA